jgi:nicotinamide phosphoribosyltransferase
MKTNPLLLCDAYKIGHVFQYPKGTTLVYSNLTPRKSRIENVDNMVFFGLQYFIKEYLINYFNDNFFNRDK